MSKVLKNREIDMMRLLLLIFFITFAMISFRFYTLVRVKRYWNRNNIVVRLFDSLLYDLLRNWELWIDFYL